MRRANDISQDDAYVPTSAYIESGAEASGDDVTEVSFVTQGDDADRGVGLSDRAFTQTMNAHNAELMACYLKGLKRDPELRGRVSFQFRIAPDGHVAVVRVLRSGLRSKRVEDCFIDTARTWTFPSAPQHSRFTTEIAFFLN